LASLALTVAPGRLCASDSIFNDVAERSSVDVVLAGGDDLSATALISTLRRSLERIGASVTFSRLAKMSPAEVAAVAKRPSKAVTVWIDIGTPKVAAIYMTEGKNVFARRFDLDRVFDSVALDLLDVVVTSSVETVLSGQPLGVTREEFARSLEQRSPVRTETPAVAPIPAPVPADEPTSSLRFFVAGFYEGSLVERTVPIGGPGVRLTGRWDSSWFAFGLHGRLPFEVSGDGATVRFAPEGLRLSAGHVFPLRRQLVLIVAGGAGVDATQVQSVSTRPGVSPVASFFAMDIVVRPSVELERRFRRLTVGVAAGLDASLVQSVYAVGATPATVPFWTPWRFRPVVALLVGLAL
jgi:hypothetical protein